MDYFTGFCIGLAVMGFIANRRPQWFAQVVKAANAVDAKANSLVQK